MTTTGALIIAHGSKDPQWVQTIDDTAAQVHTDIPVIVSFLELVENRTIADGVQQLEQMGIDRILAVPLFVSSGSTHLEEIRYALGLIPFSSIETHLQPIPSTSEIIWCQAMDDHPFMIEILLERVNQLARHPQTETLLLIGHGSEAAHFHEQWDTLLGRLSTLLKDHFGFAEASYATLYPNTLSPQANLLSQKGTMIVMPLFLSEGYLSSTWLPQQLSGYSYRYSGETYLPHPLVSRWIEHQIEAKLRVYSYR